MVDQAQKAFTGRSRLRATKRSVILTDLIARVLITFGGIGTIIAVIGVCGYLLVEVLPLFASAKVSEPRNVQAAWTGDMPVQLRVDEYRVVGWTLRPGGKLQVFRLDTGEQIEERDLFPGRAVTAISFPIGGEQGAIGLDDGTVHILKLRFVTAFVPPDQVPDDVRSKLEGSNDTDRAVNFKTGVVQKTTQGQYRHQQFEVTRVKDVKVSDGPVRELAYGSRPEGPMICSLSGDGDAAKLVALVGREVDDFLTGARTLKFDALIELPYQSLSTARVKFVGISGPGSDIYVVWEDGQILRMNAQRLDEVKVAETGRLVEQGVTLTHVAFVLSNNTIVWGDSKGRVAGGFLVRIPEEFAPESDHEFLQQHTLYDAKRAEDEQNAFAISKHLTRSGPVLTSTAASERSRLMLCGFADGSIKLFNVTNEGLLASMKLPDPAEVKRLVFAPKEDGLLAVTDSKVYSYQMDPMFHEVTLGSLFLPVWYEGYSKPEHTWQSSAGHTGAELKFGMMPLIFGTIKATVYAMLIGAPLALLAAIYSSEFLHPRIKAGIKPTIEMMASLPSVVLGFVAALVFAPIVEDIVPTTLAAFFLLPVAFLLGAYIWQLLPHQWTLRLSHTRFVFFVLPVVVGIAAAVVIGPLVQNALFHGEIKGWLQYSPMDAQATALQMSDEAKAAGQAQAASAARQLAELIDTRQIDAAQAAALDLAGMLQHPESVAQAERLASRLRHHDSTFGWLLLLLPLCGVITALIYARTVSEWLRRHANDWSRTQLAWADLGKFGSGLLVTILMALMFGALLDMVGFDPRGPWRVWGLDFSVMGTYQQRNSLIVGFFMGFAVIPIIYTIADDALSSVPEHLRSASLGAGATPWQTAVRIVIPTAMSGLFSALMIGLGRAVGETMIVLMATGNTPVLEMNIFNGLRTLSANIAVELPEAAKGDVHFRALFFAALVLFAMTFVVNLVAEMVRLRFRKRAGAL